MAPASETEVDVGEGGSEKALSQADCICPVCLEIFVEPVTLPCAHTFCKPCFLETVDKANLCCPLCRRRVSTWARLHGRKKTLVNMELWSRLQEAFPTQCQRRISGQDAGELATVASTPRVSPPGEVRREYEDQISKLAEEKRALEDAERRASEEYIQRLLAEEEERRAEERRRLEETQLEEDERLARLLSQELNSTPMSESQRNVRPAESTSTKKKSSAGDIERFLLPLPLRSPNSTENSPCSSLTANKENILVLPSPAASEEAPMPALDFCGNEPGARSDPEDAEPLPSGSSRAQSELDGWTRGGASGKRKGGELDWGRGKRPRAPAGCLSDSPLVCEMLQEEEALFCRRQQEESDRQLAQRLQRQLDQEEVQRAVNRSKGSADEYPLREKAEPGASSRGRCSTPAPRELRNRAKRQLSSTSKERQTPRRSPSGPAPVSSPGPCSTGPGPGRSSALQKGSKQTTLTEMFPSLAS